MKTATRIQRLGAAIAAVAMTLSIVWMISGYAYPQMPAAWLDQLAKKAAPSPRS